MIQTSLEQAKKGTEIVMQILKAAHQTAKAVIRAKPLEDAISAYERSVSIRMIWEYTGKYRTIIDATYPLTGRFVIYDVNYYDDKSDDYIKADLQFLVLMVYLQAAAEHGLSTVAEKAMQKYFGELEDANHVHQ